MQVSLEPVNNHCGCWRGPERQEVRAPGSDGCRGLTDPGGAASRCDYPTPAGGTLGHGGVISPPFDIHCFPLFLISMV